MLTVFLGGCGLPLKRKLGDKESYLLNQLILKRSHVNTALEVNRPPCSKVGAFLEGFSFSMIFGAAYYGMGILAAPIVGVYSAKRVEDKVVVDKVVKELEGIFEPTRLQARLEDEIIKAAAGAGYSLHVVELQPDIYSSKENTGQLNPPTLTAELKDICYGLGFMSESTSLKLSVNVKITNGNHELVDTCYEVSGPTLEVTKPFAYLLKEGFSLVNQELDESLKILSDDIIAEQFNISSRKHNDNFNLRHINWCICSCNTC